MKERLTNVIHWICFLVGILLTTGMLQYYVSARGGLSTDYSYLFPTLLFLLGGWALKYLLTGRKGFFPWMTK